MTQIMHFDASLLKSTLIESILCPCPSALLRIDIIRSIKYRTTMARFRFSRHRFVLEGLKAEPAL